MNSLLGLVMLDASTSLIAFISCYLSGHGKFETLGALGISCMLLATAGGIAWHAVDVLLVWTIFLSSVPIPRGIYLVQYLGVEEIMNNC